ncbi:Hypothetical protein PACV_185 [Pacmanvirus A23]|uniref:Hypothetical protein n=1 Tax=Pacmanvirus A23 TaxID=1932881 RepID=UPI000A0937D1|nr:Hypothetical protein B9W72_gp183 [Pacmanvirus A23]SIP85900.1 Hypothetical protein PACV_185 [Pacmanvirus A23]
MAGVVAKQAEIFQNYIDFAKNRGVDDFDTLFDFLPDEILEKIIKHQVTIYNVNINLTMVCKRFDAIYLSIMDRKTQRSYLKSKNPHPVTNWREKMDSLNFLTLREVSILLFNRRQFIFDYPHSFVIDCRKTKRCVFYIGNESHYITNYSKAKTYQVDEEIEFITNDIGGLFTSDY